MQEKESIMGHRLKIGIFNPRDDRAVWYLGGASVPPGPVIPRVEKADLKSMPIIHSHNHTVRKTNKEVCTPSEDSDQL